MKGKIFNAQEVQAIIAGTKTMFREVIKPRIKVENYKLDDGSGIGMEILLEECPYQVGQKIFCKERFFVSNYIELRYEANLSIDEKYYWLPAIKMKREHSRLTLEITDVKVERLQSISQEDCAKEGIPHAMWQANGRFFSAPGEPIEIGFAGNWNATHKKPEEKFEVNPFVWVVDFKINK